ncbi:MAG: argininosuccinate lyase [Candidatus Hydrothermarchaeales archaeon]
MMLRGGRLGKELDERVAKYTSSLEFDRGIFEYDILNDMAHVIMLSEKGIIEGNDASVILKGLKSILETGVDNLDLDPKKEDIHIVIEDHLATKIGEVSGKMHTARSRNDQIACDLRMKAREEINLTSENLIELVETLLKKSTENVETIMPGYTHLQQAQPTTLAHHYLAFADAFLRCIDRLEEAYARMNLNPLGAGALSTTTFDIDRFRTSKLLGFDGVLENSEDAVSSRDFMLEILAGFSILAVEISRFAEELVLWSSFEFGMVELDDKFASTSSIMPQKKNPDVVELVRANITKVLGNFTSVAGILKSLPYTYNRDLQELSPIFFESFVILNDTLEIMASVIDSLKVNKDRMKELCDANFSQATDLADLIVKEKGLPFRTAHKVVGKTVSKAMESGMKCSEIDSKMLDSVSEEVFGEKLNLSDEKIKKALNPAEGVKARSVLGGPAPLEVKRILDARKDEVEGKKSQLKDRRDKIKTSKDELLDLVGKAIGE